MGDSYLVGAVVSVCVVCDRLTPLPVRASGSTRAGPSSGCAANDDAIKLAKGLRAALDKTASTKS